MQAGQAVTVLHPHQTARTSQHVKPLWADSGGMKCINLEKLKQTPEERFLSDLFPHCCIDGAMRKADLEHIMRFCP